MARIHVRIWKLNLSLGNSLGHVFRSAEHQATGLVPDLHRREKVDKYVTASTVLTVCSSHLLPCLPVYRRNPKEKKEHKETKEPDTVRKPTLKVTDQYIALLIRVFVAAGLLDVRTLVSSGSQDNP